MNEMEKDKTLIVFFRYLFFGFVISVINSDLRHLDIYQMFKLIFTLFIFSLVSSTIFAVFGMITYIIFAVLKKNLKDENVFNWNGKYGYWNRNSIQY